MDGVALIVRLLMEDEALTALVPASRIMAGVLPESTVLPAVAVTTVSRVDHHPLKKTTMTMVRERVQATVLAASYDSQKEVLRAVRKAVTAIQMPDFWASVPDWYSYLFAPFIHNVAVVTDAAGPDFMLEDANINVGSQDYRVVYNEER